MPRKDDDVADRLDPSALGPDGRTVVDLRAPIAEPRRTLVDAAPPAPRDYANVAVVSPAQPDDAERAAGAKPATAMVLSSRSRGLDVPAHPEDPPHIVVARHELTAELATDPRLVLVREPDSERSAAYRVLRHQVTQKGNPRVTVVSSALQGEGKTTCAVNLALALGECERARVLLVEANLRQPRLGAIFRFEPPWCFAQQLVEHRERPDERWSVVEVAPHGLHVMAVDPRTEQRPLLDAPAFALAMDRMRRAGYDYVVIDAPPVLGSAEVNLLQDAADGVLLVTRSKMSRGREVRKAVQQLSPGRVLGVTMIDQ
jgi:Mrp family chromosome partitioning ATPase